MDSKYTMDLRNTLQVEKSDELFGRSFQVLNHFKKPKALLLHRKNAFKDIFSACLFIGLPLKPQSLSSNAKHLSFKVKIWCTMLTTIKTLLFVMSALNVIRVIPTLSSQIKFTLFGVCGFVNMWIVIRRRKLIAIRDVCDLALQLNPRFQIGSRRSKMEIALLMTAVSILLIIQVAYVFYQEWEKCLEILAFPLIEQSSCLSVYVWIIMFSIVMTYNIAGWTCYLLLLLCYNSYFTLGKVINFYSKMVKGDLIRGNCTYKQLSRHISLFVDITQKVKEIDQALGAIAFFLYITVI
ncbi:uncharacterized protein TNCT_38881 [Trichonephila clavata]|uniref:Uncharacterized protein n=1 Tax=Trichonephila clavata TaxID=2740835 RepID=A0A8X6GIF8_TRICU|nr:uncharacterized protein TNCT_38881 [Trichonephila clavata]